MDSLLTSLPDINAWLAENKELATIISGILGLLTACVGLLASLLGRATVVLVHGSSAGTAQYPRLPLKLSLKSVLKGWISILIWSAIVFFIAGFVMAFLASRQSPAVPEPPAGALAPEVERPDFDLQRSIKMMEDLLKPESAQIVVLVLIGLVYMRGAYVAARSVKTTMLMKMCNALIAIATLEIGSALLVQHFYPEMLAMTKPLLVQKWEYVVIAVAALLGAILGSED